MRTTCFEFLKCKEIKIESFNFQLCILKLGTDKFGERKNDNISTSKKSNPTVIPKYITPFLNYLQLQEIGMLD